MAAEDLHIGDDLIGGLCVTWRVQRTARGGDREGRSTGSAQNSIQLSSSDNRSGNTASDPAVAFPER